MAQQFLDENTIVGFDLINEPWGFAHGNEALIGLYERIIDAIRGVDPYRTCFVQSMYYHYQTTEWRNVLLTNPVNRSNVVYAVHLYSQDPATGEWYDSYTCPWIPYYLNHDYVRAKELLRNTTEGGHGWISKIWLHKARARIPRCRNRGGNHRYKRRTPIPKRCLGHSQ